MSESNSLVAEQPPSRNPDPFSPTWRTYVNGMFYGLFFLGILWMIWMGTRDFLWPSYRIRYEYVPVRATVLEAAMEEERGNKGIVYNPKVRLRYTAASVTCDSWCRLDWSSTYGQLPRAQADLQGYAVGADVAAWYDPDAPGNVAVNRNCAWAIGALTVGLGLACLFIFVGLPSILLFYTSLRHQGFEWTTGRVTAGEVREAPPVNGKPQYRAVLLIEFDRGNSLFQSKVEGNPQPSRAVAESDLRGGLLAYPVGEQRPIWYDPKDPHSAIFERVTLFDAALRSLILCSAPLVLLVTGPFVLARHLWQSVFDPAPKWAEPIQENEHQTSPPPISNAKERRRNVWQGCILFAAMLGALGYLTVWPDFESFFVYRQGTATILESWAQSTKEHGFLPRVKYAFDCDGVHYERSGHPFDCRGENFYQVIDEKSQVEAIAARYRPGQQVPYWYDPKIPGKAFLNREVHWHYYLVLIPPLAALVFFGRRLFS